MTIDRAQIANWHGELDALLGDVEPGHQVTYQRFNAADMTPDEVPFLNPQDLSVFTYLAGQMHGYATALGLTIEQLLQATHHPKQRPTP